MDGNIEEIPVETVTDSAQPSQRRGRRRAIFFDSPNHISFLSTPTNEAMVSYLSPLLPVAKLLGVPLLDFDTYSTTRDSDATAAKFIPLVESFFLEGTEIKKARL